MMMLLNGPNDPYTIVYIFFVLIPYHMHDAIQQYILYHHFFFVDIIFALSTFDFAHPCGSLHIMNYK